MRQCAGFRRHDDRSLSPVKTGVQSGVAMDAGFRRHDDRKVIAGMTNLNGMTNG